MSPSTRNGLLLAVGAHFLWGVFPIYWNLLSHFPSIQLVCHRIAWAFAFSVVIALIRYRFASRTRRLRLWIQISRAKTWRTYGLAAVLIAINWLSFLYAVNNDRVLFSSLGYYINPLFNVLLGVFVLGETLSRRGWWAIGLAAVGVSVMTLSVGEFPWVSFAMASTFAFYALVKKTAKLDALHGLLIELSVLIVPTLLYLCWVSSQSQNQFQFENSIETWLMVMGGLVTIVPLALFAAATQRAPLSLIGILQYVGPTMQFLVGVFYFGEPLSQTTVVGFAFVWTGIAVFWSRSPIAAHSNDAQVANHQERFRQ